MRSKEEIAQRTKRNLDGVKRPLQLIVENSSVVPGYSMAVIEGVRSIEDQERYLKTGASKTMNSRHLTGHAFDFAMFDNAKNSPNDYVKEVEPAYREQWELFKETSKRLGIPLTWGGDWRGINDGGHVQLTWKDYPLLKEPKTQSNSTTIAAAGAGIPVTAFVPELIGQFKELVPSLSFLDSTWMSGIQLVLLLGIAAYIVRERYNKLEREGV